MGNWTNRSFSGQPAGTVNALNQYDLVFNAGLPLTGLAPVAQEVYINGVNLSTQAGRYARWYGQFLQNTQTDDEKRQWRSVEVTGPDGIPSFADGHQYVAPRRATLVYDDDGNLIENDRWLFTWDAENRLTSMVTCPSAVLAGVPEQKLEFAYDAMGRRIQKKVSLKSGGVWSLKDDVRFVYDGWNLVAEAAYWQNAGDAPWTGGNAAYLRRTYMWGPDVTGTWEGAGGVGGLLAMTRHARGTQPAESYWATADLNGNVIGLLSTSGTKTAVYDYDAFGKVVRVNEPEAGLNPVRFSSKYQDVETGLSYYGYRYYSAETGRWISRDPIGERGGINLYGMVGNDPVNWVDRLGQAPINNKCGGICGAIVDDWIVDEINAQRAGWKSSGLSSIDDYLKWANGNQRYKDSDFFEFNKGTKCGTHDKGVANGCGISVTLCGLCVRSSILGSLMYGLIARDAGFSGVDTVKKPSDVKSGLGMTVSPNDEDAYSAGWYMGRKLPATITLGDVCSRLREMTGKIPSALKESNATGGVNDLSSCRPCSDKTKETRHGGSAPSRIRP